MMKTKGFTLIEILMVVVIIGVLASLVLPRYFGQTERAVVGEAVAHLSAIRQAEEAFRLENGSYTQDLDLLDIDVPHLDGTHAPSSTDKFVYQILSADAVSFAAEASRRNVDNPSNCDRKTIVLTNGGLFSGTHPFGPNPDAGAACW